MLSARRILLATRKGGSKGPGKAASTAAAPRGRSDSKEPRRSDGPDSGSGRSSSKANRKPSLTASVAVELHSLMMKGVSEVKEERQLTETAEVSTTNTGATNTPKPKKKFNFTFGETPAEKKAREEGGGTPSSFGGRSLDGSRIPTEGEEGRDFAEKMAEASPLSVVISDHRPRDGGRGGGEKGDGSSGATKTGPSTLGLFCRQWKYSVINPTEESRTTVLAELEELELAFRALPVEDSRTPAGAARARKEGQLMMAKLRAGITFRMSEEYYGPSISWLTVHFKRLSDEDFAMALHDIHCLAGHIQDPNLAHAHSTLQDMMERKMKESVDTMNATLSPLSRLATVFHYVNKTHSKIPPALRTQLISELSEGKLLVESSKETDPKRMMAIALMSLSVQSIFASDSDMKHTIQIMDSILAKNPNMTFEIHADDLVTVLRSLRMKKALSGRKMILTKNLLRYAMEHDYDALYQILTWSFVTPSERELITEALGDCAHLEELRVVVAAANFMGPGNNVAVRRGVELLLGTGEAEGGVEGEEAAQEGEGEVAVEGGGEQGAQQGEEVYFGDDEFDGYEEGNSRHGSLTDEQGDDDMQAPLDEGEGLAYLVMKSLCHQDVPETKQILCLFAQPTITKELNHASLGCFHLVTRFLSLVENGVHLSEEELAELAPPNQEVHERLQVNYNTDNVLLKWCLGMISGSFDVSIEPLINKLNPAQLSLSLLQASRIYNQLVSIKASHCKNNPRLVDDLDSTIDMLVEMGERFAVKYMDLSSRASPLITRRSVILRLPMELEAAQKLATQFVVGASGVWSASVALREVLPIAVQEPANPVLVARTVALIQRTELPRDPFSLFYTADDGPTILKNVNALVQLHARFSPDSQVGPSVVNRVARWYGVFLTMVEAGLVEHPEWATSSPPPMLDVEENASGFSDLFEAPPQTPAHPWHIEEVLSVLFQARASIPAELNAFVKRNVWDIFYGEEPDTCAKMLQGFPEGLPRRFTSHYVAALRSQILNHMDLSPRNIGLMLDTSQASGFPLLLLSVEQAGGDSIQVLQRVVTCPSSTCALVLRVWGAAPSHSSRTFLSDPSYPDILALLETIAERVEKDDACLLLRSPTHVMQLPPTVVEALWNATDDCMLMTSDAAASTDLPPPADRGDGADATTAEAVGKSPEPPTKVAGDIAVYISKPKMIGLPQPECLLSIAIKVPDLADDICLALAGRQINFVHLLCNMQTRVPIQFVNCAVVQCCNQIARAKPAQTEEVAKVEPEEKDEGSSSAADEPAPQVELTTAATPTEVAPTPTKHLSTTTSGGMVAGVFGTSVRLLKYLDQHVFTFEAIADLPIDCLHLFTRLLNSVSELSRGAAAEVEIMLLTSGRIYGRLLRRKYEVEELMGIEPSAAQKSRNRQQPKRLVPHLMRSTLTEEELAQTLAALQGVLTSTSAIIDAFVRFDATTPARLQKTFGTVPQSMKRLMMDIKLEDLVVDAIMALPQAAYKINKDPAADPVLEEIAEEEHHVPRVLDGASSARLYQYIETLERNGVYQEKAQAAVVKVVTRPLVEIYRRVTDQNPTVLPESERKKVHTMQLNHIEYALSVLRSSLRGGASEETISKLTRGLILAGSAFKVGSSQPPSSEASSATTSVVDHLGRLLQAFLDAPVKSKAHKLVVEALISEDVVPDLTGPWFAKITVAMSRLGSLGDFRDRIGNLLGRLFAAADPHSQTLIFRALSADEQIVKSNLDLLFDVVERSVSVLSPEDLENVASALTQTSTFIAFADIEELVEQLCIRVLAVIEVAKKSSLVRILHLLTHFKLQDIGVLEAIYTSLEDKMPKLDVNQLLTILSSMVELDMIPRERLILQVIKRLETNVDNMSPTQIVHTLSFLVDLNVAFLPVTNALFMKANESKDAIRQSKALTALMEKASTEFIIEAPEHVTRHFLKKQKERTRMRALHEFNLEQRQRKLRDEEATAKH